MSLKDAIKSWIKPITAINQAVLPTGNDYTFTPNLGLIKPGLNNYYDIMEHNFNSELLDKTIAELADHVDAKFTELMNTGIGHNGIYRGKSLGENITSEQYAAIADGSFRDLYIGDYWTIGGIKYVIAAFNYYLNTGDVPVTKNHVTLVPEKVLYNHVMNDTATTTGGYMGSKMYQLGLNAARSRFMNAFPDHVLKHRLRFTNVVSNGLPTGTSWVDADVYLMNEHMVYGAPAFMPIGNGTSAPDNSRVQKSQLPLFFFNPTMINTCETYWLQDVISAIAFAAVDYGGHPRSSVANMDYANGVRPAFSIY